MIDPTQTQPLAWRMHQGHAMPSEEIPVEPPNRQAPTFDSSIPDRLSERGYRLRARLGSGRLGPIYEAQDELSRISGSQHFVAIQLIDDKIAARPGFASEFERGAATLKSVSHPNIVKLLEYGCDRDRYYLVTELLESASLRFVLNDAGQLPGAESTAVLRAIGDALQYLHAKSIVHGNLRPENVLVTFGYEVKLLDIAPPGWLVSPNDALGVPARAPDKRDDVFGLACLAYEMLAGRHPYNGNSAQEAYRAGLEPVPIEGLPDRQWRALSNALAVHRDDRTPSVAQFLDDFGVGSVQKLRSVVAAGGDERPVRELPAAAPAIAQPRPVVAERAAAVAPERRAWPGALLSLLAVIAIAVAAWYYQEPLRTFATDLMAEVDAQMDRASGAADQAAGGSPAQAPLPQAPEVVDRAPAMVLAPGATAPESTGTGTRSSASTEPESGSTAPAADAVPAGTLPEPGESGAAAEAAPAPAAAASATPGMSEFGFERAVVTVREGDVAARIVIRRTGDLSAPAAVSWWTAGGTALPDADYADLGARVERFGPGESSRTVYVPLTNDAVAEPTKNFRVFLARGEGARGDATVSEMRVDIVDDD